ncbi:dystroglycan 1-like [Uloborus diversus]|uniref:dystroglycan 1-like n=1 Tax=Uloborus diversus TaxID=327109 RepID=UPI0024094399|nr:dystroglycan 1-like [Uloborus diversus]
MTKRAAGHLPLLHLWLFAALGASSVAIKRDQGVPDTRAYVGRVFKLHLPENAFQGHAEQYQVTEAGENTLPKWLQFDSNQHIFTGVPASSDAGQLYICIKAIEKESVAKDVFSIEVIEDSSEMEDCQFGQVETVAAIVIDATLSDLQPIDKLRIIQALASHLNLPESKFQLAALHREESSFDQSAIRAGPGNALQRSYDGIRVLFSVGCNNEISHQFEPVLKTVEKNAANGELADVVGHLIVGWQVAGKVNSILPQMRERRNVTPFRPTPVPKLHLTRWPSYTERIDEAETKEVVPEIRIIPTMSSPIFTTQTTSDHRHRHHHGQDPFRREHFYPVTEIMASPTYRYHPFPTSQHRPGSTAVPTPVLQPDRPTTAVVPTRIYDIDGTISFIPEHPPVSEDVLSRWYDISTDVSTADIRPTSSRTTVEPTKLMPQTPNFKPTVNSRIKKLSLVAGKAWTYQIPLDTFIDIEDGNTRDLRLIFKTSEHASLPSHSWIQLDPEKQIMYALPLSDNIGKHEFVLEAMDSEGASTFDRVELHVWQHPLADTLSHSFTMTVRYNKWQYPVGIDWQIEILSRLARLFGDHDSSNLCVLSVTLDPIKLTWTNDTLPTDMCPLDQIQYIYDMIATPEHHPTKKMKKFMESEFRVQDFSVSYRGACQGLVTTQPPALNFAPRLRNPIKRINVTVGDVIKHKIPDDTFYDFEDGSTRHLRLTLLTAGHIHPQPSYWLQFDSRSQEIYGLPSEADIGRHDFFLNAMDSDGHSVSDNFIIHVYRIPRRKKPPVEFSILIDYDFDDFNADTSKKTLIASKLARLYGDPSPQYMMITNITRGSILYAWSNKTLGNDYCPKEKIDQLVKYIINDDGTLANGLLQIMEPEFRVISADAVPTGVCLGGVPPTFVTITTTTPQPSPPPEELEPTLKTSTDDDIYITTIVPAIVIAIMLVIAAIVAYFLYWKKRKGKMSLGDKDFIGSGVPVVFAGELEEQKPDPGKAPAIMKNEKPPLSTDHLLNPFRSVTAAVRNVTSRDIETAPKLRESTTLRDRKDTSTLYKPPPPFPSSREGKGTRPKSTQAYRHATYVPP